MPRPAAVVTGDYPDRHMAGGGSGRRLVTTKRDEPRDKRKERTMSKRTRANEAPSGVTGGAILVTLGTLFLAQKYFSFDTGNYGWPIFIIGPGLLFFAAMLVGGRGLGSLAIPGSIITTIGLMLFLQNLTGRYETWAYSWALIPTAVGVGLQIAGHRDGIAAMVREGQRLMQIGLMLFLVFGASFELFIFHSSALAPYIFPAALILGGAALVVRNTARTRRTASFADPFEDSAQGGWTL
jgi:hypothetical protein